MDKAIDPIVSLNKVTRYFGDNVAINEITTKIYPGNFYGLLGINGAGKSTLIKIMSQQEYFNSGEGTIFDLNLKADLAQKKEYIGCVSEQIGVGLSVPLKVFFKAYSKVFSNWDNILFEKFIEQQQLDLNREFLSFSRGQQMQIMLIAVLARNPKILFVDEITSVLDVYIRHKILEYLKDFTKRGGTVVITTNIIREIENYVTHVLILKNGSLLVDSDLSSIAGQLIKIRKTKDNCNLEIFNSSKLFWVGKNSDFSDSYLVEEKTIAEIEGKDCKQLRDNRKIMLEEIFMYYVGRERENQIYGKIAKDE